MSTHPDRYIIRRCSDGKFWATPGVWSAECAFDFPTWKAATEEALASTPSFDHSEIIFGFGSDAQCVVLTVAGTILPLP